MENCNKPSAWKYQQGCRCDACKKICSEYRKDLRSRRYRGVKESLYDINREKRRNSLVTDCGNASKRSYDHGCRCDGCKLAYADYMRDYRKRKQKKNMLEAREATMRQIKEKNNDSRGNGVRGDL